MNISLLDFVLDDERAYMDVPKELFLKKINKEFDWLKKKGITQFSQVVKGYCGDCNKGCGGYTFLTDNKDYLDLLFEEEGNEIQDIYICSKFINEKEIEKEYEVYFSFYEDEKTNFKPSIDILIKKSNIEIAEEDFNQFKNNITDVEDICNWHYNSEKIGNSFDLFEEFDYKFYKSFGKIKAEISSIYEIVAKYKLAVKAMKEFNSFDLKNEKNLVNWVLKYKNDNISFSSYEKNKNWEQNSLIHLESDPTVIFDCSKYKESLLFSDIYERYYLMLCEKYSPTKKHFEQNGGEVEGSLSTFLYLHGVHLDILVNHKSEI